MTDDRTTDDRVTDDRVTDDLLNDDRALLEQLRRMWEAQDPEPADLAERVLFALGLEDVEFELLQLRDALDPTGARGVDLANARSAETVRTVTFGSDSLTVMISLSGPHHHGHRIDGWIAPGGALRIELRTTRGALETMADQTGRFALTEVPSGLVQLVIHPTEGAAVALIHPVVTPAMQL
jgi:hypothetical protein